MDAIPAPVRKALYVALFVAGVVVGALNVADVNTGKAVDVIAYLGTALGLVAAGNVGKPFTKVIVGEKGRELYVPPKDESGASVVYVLAVIALVLGIIFLWQRI